MDEYAWIRGIGCMNRGMNGWGKWLRGRNEWIEGYWERGKVSRVTSRGRKAWLSFEIETRSQFPFSSQDYPTPQSGHAC